MTVLEIRAYGIGPNDLTDAEMEDLAQYIHNVIQEEFMPIETVHIEGYMTDREVNR